MRKRLKKKNAQKRLRQHEFLANTFLRTSFNEAPGGMPCPECSAVFPQFGIRIGLFLGPYGVLECKSCGYRETGLHHLVTHMLTVEPLESEEPSNEC